MTFKTDDIEGAIAHVGALGFELVDVNLSNPQWKEAFFRPSKSHGTLIQVAQSGAPDEEVKKFLKPSNLEELLEES